MKTSRTPEYLVASNLAVKDNVFIPDKPTAEDLAKAVYELSALLYDANSLTELQKTMACAASFQLISKWWRVDRTPATTIEESLDGFSYFYDWLKIPASIFNAVDLTSLE